MDALSASRHIEASYRSYLRTTFSPRRAAWRDAFHQALDTEMDLTRGPFLEATPPFVPGATTAALIEEGLLSEPFRRLHDVFPLDRPLYVHQERAVRRALDGRNLLVATGTGSGKTECVLIPAVEALLREAVAGTLAEPGVRTLLLYPMNALANDQLRRFREWFAHFPDITFGRFVGETRETQREALDIYRAIQGADPLPNELISREVMRDKPPHILVTNYSMLEYLLIRPADTALFDGATGRHWRHIALDEAHVYDGADGAEVAMLLRRLRDRVVGSRPGALQVIATSATLGRGSEDTPTLVRFGSDLFDELFEPEDIVGPERLPLASRRPTGRLPDATYTWLALEARETAAEGQTLNAGRLRDGLAATGVDPAAIAPGSDDPDALLHALLANDERLIALQRVLDKARVIMPRDAGALVFGDSHHEQAVVDLVELGVRARAHPADAPLLPARYHHWLRGLEGGFACLHPSHPADTPPFFLVVTDTCPGCEAAGIVSRTVELGACNTCRGDYAIGTGSIGGPMRRVPIGQEPSAYLLLDEGPTEADEESEDDGGEDDAGEVTEQVAWYCPGCAFLLDADGDACGCEGAPPVRRRGVLAIVSSDGDTRLRACLSCRTPARGGRIVGRFLTDANAPAVVIATSLYQELPPASDPRVAQRVGEGRKLLAFADSRQDAAFFAPYLEHTYERALRRSLLLSAMEAADQGGGLRPADLAGPLEDLADQHQLLDVERARDRRKRVLTWVAQELLALDRRRSLAGVGLVRVAPALPAAVPDSLAAVGLSDEASRDLLALLLDSLRVQGALRMPGDVDRRDSVFEPLNLDIAVRGAGSERYVVSWTPDRRNRRSDLVGRVFANAGVEQDPRPLLSALWDELTAPDSPWLALLPDTKDKRYGLVRRLDVDRIEFTLARNAGPSYRCERCAMLTWVNVLGTCPTYGCNGRLTEVPANEEPGHYAELYRSMAPLPLTAKEHTAQWAMDQGTDIQQQFLDGRLNALSCSTTFELGVDVGDVEGVLLRNVPPTVANYVQRAGRAGRRAGAAALVVTLAQRRNHDIAWFRAPETMVGGSVTPPRIVTENPIIARRHAHSMAVAAFLLHEPEIRNVGDFFEVRDEAGTAGVERFLAYLRTQPPDLGAALRRVVPTATHAALDLDGWGWVDALVEATEDDPSSGWLGRAIAEVNEDLASLIAMRHVVVARLAGGSDQKALGSLKGLDYQLNTLRRRHLIGFLAQRNVLPKYGFPVDVVELDLSRTGDRDAGGIELTRDLRIAIGEYAPGSQVVANGVAWRSTGLRRFRDQTWPEHGWAVCAECGRYREAIADEPPIACGTCGSTELGPERGRRVRPIFGFHGARTGAVTGDELIARRRSMRSWFTSYGPGDEPEPEPVAGLAPGAAETLVSRQGRIVVMNLGPASRGFLLCERCGHGRPVPTARSRRKGRKKDSAHDVPWGGKPCTGTLRHVQLSTDFLTDIVEIRLAASPADEPMRSALYALLEGASTLGIKRDEIDGTIHAWSRDRRSFVLYDVVPGGAGHASRIDERFADVVDAAVERVRDCDCGLDTSCYGCLRSYGNQFWHESLSRRGAFEVLEPLLR